MKIWISFILLFSFSVLAETSNYYVERRSYGTLRDTEPPRYVKPLKSWLDLGLDYRLRYEHRDNDFRRARQVTDNPLLHRTRIYLGIKDFLGPLRLGLELSDARRSHSVFPKDNRDVNELEPLQAFGELYFQNLLGEDRPASLKVGRLAFEYLDRRLIARNEWRNTTNTFEGARLKLGQEKNDWQLDVLALRPLIRIQEKIDPVDQAQKFYGAIGDIRRWSKVVTLQPYYLALEQDGEKVLYNQSGNRVTSNGIDRLIHTTGLRAYGIVGNSHFDYDGNYAIQKGNNGNQQQDAKSYIAELGYSPQYNWKPRLSLNHGFASGDKKIGDRRQQRFERLFGFSRPWSNNDYIQMENIKALKLRGEVEPFQNWRLDAGWNWYWLDSAKDLWSSANLQDSNGKSGKDIGQEFDVRSRFQHTKLISTQIGYAYFMGGRFTKKTSPDRESNSHFFYYEMTLTAF